MVPAAGQGAAAASTTTCLVNKVRTARGLRRVTAEPHLAAIARSWTARIVTGRFWAHVDPQTGSTIDTRARAGGYLTGASIWALGENLAWATGFRSSPQEIVSMWMNSPGHRENMLDPQWRQIGVGFADGTPVGAAGGTWAAEFGMRVVTSKAKTCRRVMRRIHGKRQKVCVKATARRR